MPGVTRTQRGILAMLFVALWLLSLLWWKNNANRDMLLAVHPEWENHGFVLYDGYGEYARHIRDLFVSPSRESWKALESFGQSYIHTLRPVYPLAMAVVDIPVGNMAVSASLVNLAAIAGLFFLWNGILVRFFRYEGTDLFLLHLLLLTHVSTIGSLARPVADVLAMGFVLGAMWATLDFERTGRVQTAVLAVTLIIVGTATKLIVVLLLPAMILTVAAYKRHSPHGKIVMMLGAAGGILLLAGMALLLSTDIAAAQFLRAAFSGVAAFFTNPDVLPMFLKSGVVFLALSLQIWPVCVLFNKSALSSPARLFLLWTVLYVLQRFLFYGFSLWHSRARYGFPLVAAAIVLGYPGLKRLVGERAARYVCYGLATLNIAVWLAVYIKET